MSVTRDRGTAGIRTSRARGTADVRVDETLCTGCGVCAAACAGATLSMDGGHVIVDQANLFGCIGCGACVAVCPERAITVTGRDLSGADILDLPPRDERAGYDGVLALLRGRRSARRFLERDVEPGAVGAILEAASTAPMGVPPSDVGVLVLRGRDRVGAFRADTLDWLVRTRRRLGLAIPLLRPFMRRDDYIAMRDFVLPVVDFYDRTDRQGEDRYFYDAPLAMVFYGCGFADPADPYIAASFAMIAAESLGVGSCCLGFPAYALTYSHRIRERYGLPPRVQQGLAVAFGYPAVEPRNALRRRFARVDEG